MTLLARVLGTGAGRTSSPAIDDLRPVGRQPGEPFTPKVVAPVPILCRHFGHDLRPRPSAPVCRDCGHLASVVDARLHQPSAPAYGAWSATGEDVSA